MNVNVGFRLALRSIALPLTPRNIALASPWQKMKFLN